MFHGRGENTHFAVVIYIHISKILLKSLNKYFYRVTDCHYRRAPDRFSSKASRT